MGLWMSFKFYSRITNILSRQLTKLLKNWNLLIIDAVSHNIGNRTVVWWRLIIFVVRVRISFRRHFVLDYLAISVDKFKCCSSQIRHVFSVFFFFFLLITQYFQEFFFYLRFTLQVVSYLRGQRCYYSKSSFIFCPQF